MSRTTKKRPMTSKVFISRKYRMKTRPYENKSEMKTKGEHTINGKFVRLAIIGSDTASNIMLKSINEKSPLARLKPKKKVKRSKTKGLSKKPYKIIQVYSPPNLDV